jgi:DNA replication licensing factor MCM2
LSQTLYWNYQSLTIQEPPSSSQPGRITKAKQVIIPSDLVDCSLTGYLIHIIGIFKHFLGIQCQGFPIFITTIEANNISVKGNVDDAHTISPEEKNDILEISRDPQIAQ